MLKTLVSRARRTTPAFGSPPRARLATFLVFGLLLATQSGCAPQSPWLEAPVGRVVGGRACVPPFAPAADGVGCAAVLPPGDCPSATMPVLGETACALVGWSSCPAGFASDPDGWGCRDVLPAAPCAGATMERLGSVDCQPLGDCAAPFPPAGATVFVDDDSTQTDATHFSSLTAAVAAAPSGALIAVEAGSYAGALALRRPVTVVGRCAEQVVIHGPAGTAGLEVSAAGVAVRGVTITGFRWGVVGLRGSALTLTAARVEANREIGVGLQDRASVRVTDSVIRGTLPAASGAWGFGVLVGLGATLTLERSAVVQNLRTGVMVSDPGSSASLRNSIVRDTQAGAEGEDGEGVFVEKGGSVELSSSTVVGNRNHGVACLACTLDMTDTVVRDTAAGTPLPSGQGVQVDQGGRASLTRVSLAANHGSALHVSGGSEVELTEGVVRDTASDRDRPPSGASVKDPSSRLVGHRTAWVENQGKHLAIELGATAALDRCLLARNRPISAGDDDRGVNVLDGAELTLDHSAVLATHGIAITVLETQQAQPSARVTLSHSLVRQTLPLLNGSRGEGLAVQGGRAEVLDSVIADSQEVGAFALGATSALRLERAIVERTSAAAGGSYGIGVAGTQDSAIWLLDTEVRASEHVGIATAGGSVLLWGGQVSHAEVALHAGDGEVQIVSSLPDSLAARSMLVSTQTAFVANQTRLGTGALPLPAVISAGQ